MSRRHELKTDPGPFEALWIGMKRAEFRPNDREFEVGDTLLLRETGGTRLIEAIVTHVQLGGAYGLPLEYCMLSLEIYNRGGLTPTAPP